MASNKEQEIPLNEIQINLLKPVIAERQAMEQRVFDLRNHEKGLITMVLDQNGIDPLEVEDAKLEESTLVINRKQGK